MQDKYVTSDTFEASVYTSLGFNADMDPSEERIRFVFEKTPEFNQVLDKYLEGTLQVEPLSLKTSMDIIYKRLYILRPKHNG